jgi:hypothetical protein
MIRKAVRRIFLAHCAAFLFAGGAGGQTTSTDPKLVSRALDVQQVLSWLPTDTETVIVAKDFLLPDLARLQNNRELYTKEVGFQWIALRTWGLKNGSLPEYFKNQRTLFVIEGSRQFRSPKSLGLMPFEGCTFVVFADDLSDRANLSFSTALGAAHRIEEIHGQKVLVFQEQSDGETWTTYIGFAGSNVLLVATNIDYLREVLSRMRDKNGPRALPETLPEWGYVDTRAQFWGFRHFDRSQGDRDPSSPFWDPQKFVKAPWTDQQAIGLTFSYDPVAGKGPTITYLSGDPSLGKKTLDMGNDGSKLGLAYRELDSRAIEASYSLEDSTAPLFVFYLSFLLGHGIFL